MIYNSFQETKDPAANHRPVPPPNLQPQRSSLLSTNSVHSLGPSPTAMTQIPVQPVEVPGNSVVKPSLIVGIDFVTTNNSWASGADAKEVVLSEWAGLGNMSLFKIPTKALSPTGFPIPGIIRVEYFKLLLQRNYNRYNDLIRNLPLPPGKTAVDLQKALEHKVFLDCGSYLGRRGQSATRQAAVQAGFVDSINDPRLCAKRGVFDFKSNNSFLVVDCGGGTVDLIAYEVEDENPFTVHECTSGTGAACGSRTIDANFMKLVRARVQVMNELGLLSAAKEEKIMRRCREDFSQRIRPGLRTNGHGREIGIEIGLDINCPQAQVVEGSYETRSLPLKLSTSDYRILVVGGYGASTYLFETLKNQVPPAYSRRILRPMDSVSAIVRGAVVTGIYERVLTSRVCRKHYLMMTLQRFQPGVHPEEYRIKAPDGGYRCKNTRKRFLEKGQRLVVGEQARVESFRQVLVDAPRIFEDTLYACDEYRCPEFITDPAIKTSESCTGTNGEPCFKIHFDVVLTLDVGNEIRAE
ncbi:hypothetical protein V1515DRAFT_641080 [Lipomyces mesembrius]